jgi:RNA polymerase sigma factor (sigma-70 family)
MKNGLKKAIDQLRQSLTPTGISDGQLLKSFIAERDEAAFSALVRRHGPMVLGVCRRILRNPHDSDDAFQATFLVLVQRAHSVVNRQAIASWLHTVACRSAQQAKVRNMRRQHRERQVDHLPHPLVAPQEPRDWQPLLDEELNRLPEKYRAPVILCDLEGRSRREVARQLHLAEGTLSSRLSRARRLLAQRLSRHGIVLSGGALAMSLAEASASVPPSLTGLTTKSAILVAAGQMTAVSTSISVIMKGATQAMFFAKLKATLATVLALVLGAGTLVYCASGQTGTAAKPHNELEALRTENELLKINLRVTLEKIKALEGEVLALKSRAKVDVRASTGLEMGIVVDLVEPGVHLSRDLGFLLVDPLASKRDSELRKKVIEQAMKVRPDEMDAALKSLRTAKDAESRQRALDQMEGVLRKLREELRPRTEPAGTKGKAP